MLQWSLWTLKQKGKLKFNSGIEYVTGWLQTILFVDVLLWQSREKY